MGLAGLYRYRSWGYFRQPIEWHKKLPLRIAFACVNFLIVGALLAIPFSTLQKRVLKANAPHAEGAEPTDHH